MYWNKSINFKCLVETSNFFLTWGEYNFIPQTKKCSKKIFKTIKIAKKGFYMISFLIYRGGDLVESLTKMLVMSRKICLKDWCIQPILIVVYKN